MNSESRHWFALALTVAALWLIYLLAPVITPFAISAALDLRYLWVNPWFRI